MNSFPLYNNLKRDIVKKDLTVKQKEELIDCIKKLDSNTSEIIYVLIYYYYDEYENSKSDNEIPYNAIKEKSNNKNCVNINWSLTDIPIPLRQILYKFVSLHMKKQQEDINRTF
jgi:hypothetical protein